VREAGSAVSTTRFAAVLFDLDGTLIDSAPDLAGTANDMRAARGMPPLPYADLRPHAGSGARGMLGAGLDARPGDDAYALLRDEFLDRYEARMLRHCEVFAAVGGLLDALEGHRLPWGIVTNKALRFAEPMSRALGLLPRAAVLVGGDSTPHTKPHPAPLLEAARRLGCEPQRCMYVGDDARDIVAGRAAGMATLAAAWGYLGNDPPVQAWGADCVLAEPAELLRFLELA
jgi:N-acetyl-D-muramate 6-phosphate phosphatase